MEALGPRDTDPAPTWWARGLTAHERLLGTRPGWVDFVARAVTAAPAEAASVAIADTDGWQHGFATVLRPLVDMARTRVVEEAADAAQHGGIDLATVCDRWAEQLGRRLVRIAARSLVWELNVARTGGQLTGSTPQERFTSFTRRMATSAELTSLFEQYPVLARLLGQSCMHAAGALVELMQRFATDRPAIVEGLLGGVDPGLLTAIETGNGDAHRRGRSVAMLRFGDRESVVYKPRSIALHEHFGQLARWLNTKVPGLDLRTVDCVPRPDYGWLELIAQQPCSDITEIDLFYRRQGALLALLHALDGTDIHCENLIAHGDQPVLVDVETLFHPALPPVTTMGVDPAAQALFASVRRTALLPAALVGENGALDVSGLGGDKGTAYPTDLATWDAAGTDSMRLVRRTMAFSGAQNRPRLTDREADPAEYRAALLAGFRASYDAIVANRKELVSPAGLLAACAEDEIRVVARPTQLYATMLDESTHPDVLRDALDRARAFDLLWSESADDPIRQQLVRHEIDDLWAGDVPLFVSQANSTDLWASSGERMAGILGACGVNSVIDKITRMDEVDRHNQEWLITATLATRPRPVEHRSGEPLSGPISPTAPDPQRLLSAACGIADEIVARAVRDQVRANWLGLELIDGKHWTLAPMGAGLAEGYTGVAVFLAQIGKLTGADRYTELARMALHPMPLLLDWLAADPELPEAIGCGGFHGLGGICYALARTASLLDDPGISRCLETAVELTATVVLAENTHVASGLEHLNLATGLAGGLSAMRAIHADSGLPAAGRLASAAADRLAALTGDSTIGGSRAPSRGQIDAAAPSAHAIGSATLSGHPIGSAAPCGFAMGHSGIGWALLRHAATDGDDRHARAGRAALERDPRPAAGGVGPDVGWCAGLAGSVLAHNGQLDQTSAVDALAARPPLRDMSLCHGELGAAEALTVLAADGDERARAAHDRRAGLVLRALEQHGPHCGTPDGVSSPGLLTGLAGIGYGLLRLGFADQVPSVLLLDAATRPPPRHLVSDRKTH